MRSLHNLFPSVAIVMDQMTAFGGADREMYSVLKLFPDAEIFTIMFDKSKYPTLSNRVHTSFVQKILPKSFSRHLKIFTPVAYESFDLKKYDLVISISAGPAKSVITGLHQPHVAMVMTPPRSLWDKELNVRGSKLGWIYRPLSIILNTKMRMWDWVISKRVQYWTANSKYIQKKVKKIYGVDSTVIYPGIEDKYFKIRSKEELDQVSKRYDLPKEFFLVVSRLYDYKKVDTAIRACIKANKNLVIVGDGPDRKYLEKVAKGNPKIEFIGFLKDDTEVISIYQLSKALLFCGIEDFGLIPVEAMASGIPVFAYKDGGLLETVLDHKTGEFFETEEELTKLLNHFNKSRYNREKIVENAKRFSERKFLNNLEKYLKEVYEKEVKK